MNRHYAMTLIFLSTSPPSFVGQEQSKQVAGSITGPTPKQLIIRNHSSLAVRIFQIKEYTTNTGEYLSDTALEAGTSKIVICKWPILFPWLRIYWSNDQGEFNQPISIKPPANKSFLVRVDHSVALRHLEFEAVDAVIIRDDFKGAVPIDVHLHQIDDYLSQANAYLIQQLRLGEIR